MTGPENMECVGFLYAKGNCTNLSLELQWQLLGAIFKMSYEELILMMPGKPFMKTLVFYFSNYGGFFKFVSNAI